MWLVTWRTMKMKIPKYVEKLLRERSEWAIQTHYFGKNDDPGYTIFIHKRSAYSLVGTLKREVERFCRWVESQMPSDYDHSQMPTAVIGFMPSKTRYMDQWARVTVYDPVMRNIEHLIPDKK